MIRRHNHADDRLTFGCPGCIATADEARWTNAPVRRITFRAVVPRRVAMIDGKQIEWRFTAVCQIPDGLNWRGDDEIDFGRFDVGAEMAETVPSKCKASASGMDALATADLFIVAVDPIEPASTCQQGAMFA